MFRKGKSLAFNCYIYHFSFLSNLCHLTVFQVAKKLLKLMKKSYWSSCGWKQCLKYSPPTFFGPCGKRQLECSGLVCFIDSEKSDFKYLKLGLCKTLDIIFFYHFVCFWKFHGLEKVTFEMLTLQVKMLQQSIFMLKLTEVLIIFEKIIKFWSIGTISNHKRTNPKNFGQRNRKTLWKFLVIFHSSFGRENKILEMKPSATAASRPRMKRRTSHLDPNWNTSK